MTLERSSYTLSWVLLVLATPPTLFTLVYCLGTFETEARVRNTGDARTIEILFSLLPMLLLAALWWPGLRVLGRLRKALADQTCLAARTWLWTGVFNLLLTLAVALPAVADWSSGGVNVWLVLIVFGLPALLSTQVVISGLGWWQARMSVERF